MFNWQQKGWPRATVDRAALREELDAFRASLVAARKFLAKPRDPEAIARALAQEAVKTSAIEGVNVDESVVMSSICKVLGVAYAPKGFTKDVRAEGVAQMMLQVRKDWNRPLTEAMLRRWHRALLTGRETEITVGDFRHHAAPMRVIRQDAYGETEIRFEAPPSIRVPKEIRAFLEMWKMPAEKPVDVALKCVMLHPHFESIHPFEDGNGRVGRALVAKTLAEGLGLPLILPVSAIIARHRAAYYDEVNEASRSLEWTGWAAFFIPVLTETVNEFVAAVKFIAAKRAYLAKYEAKFSGRAKKVILRMFEDGLEGVRSGLSAAKWMRMAKVSKPTASRDLSELEQFGAILALNDGPQTRYRLNSPICEPAEPLNEPLKREPIDTINDTIKQEPMAGMNLRVYRLIMKYPGKGVPFLKAALTVSRPTIARAIDVLVKAGKVEHRGSKKTGGYYPS